jgi:endonuclease/exonuclease/phosphatase family metal-dependent hydrolase
MPELAVLTFNVMFELLDHDDVPPWDERREACVSALRAAAVDAIALQETSPAQLTFIAGALADEFDLWTHRVTISDGLLAELRERYGQRLPAELAEVALLTRRASLDVAHMTHWWLSPTPDVDLSVGYGKRVPRLAVAVRAEHRATGLRLTLATTHVDLSAPMPQTAVCLHRLTPEATAGRSVILFGDLNTQTDWRGYDLMLAAGWRDASSAQLERAQHADADRWMGDASTPSARIDHILYRSDRLAPINWRVIEDPSGMRLSDHAPVVATFALM